MKNVRYFSCIPVNSKKPTTVYRFYDIDGKSPERFTTESGWVEDDRLFSLFMDGSIIDEEEISEVEAMNVLRELGNNE